MGLRTARHRRGDALADTLATCRTLARYATCAIPQAREEIARWRAAAARIPDRTLRAHALATIDDEALNAEAAAVFATTAPRRRRRAVIALTVAWQLLFDLLDTLTEQPADDPLANGRHLLQALVDTMTAAPIDGRRYFAASSTPAGDGGYLATLVATCRARISALPAIASVRPILTHEARRCVEAQAHTHAAALTGETTALRAWAAATTPSPELAWWEAAAAGVSSLTVHALLAAAADATTARPTAERLAAAYAASIAPLSTLLDSLIDHRGDRATGEFSYVAFYPAADRAAALAALARRGARLAPTLPRPRRHHAILVGLAAYYLAAGDPRDATTIGAPLQPAIGPALLVLRLRRRWARHRRERAAPRTLAR